MASSPPPSLPDKKTLAAEAIADVWELLDRQLSPLGLRAIDALSPKAGESIADIGCGGGQTTLQLAERVGPSGAVIGVDIAPLLVKLARRRASGLRQVRFVACDAAELPLTEESLDGLYSRFGVMAFDDPAAAFSHLRRLLKPSGRLAFVCWRRLSDNELDRLPLSAAGLAAMADPTPFSLADPERIEAVLTSAGYRQVSLRPHDEQVSSGDMDAMAQVLLRVGPLGRILRENPNLRADAEPRLRHVLRARGDPSRVSLTAATWIVTALA